MRHFCVDIERGLVFPLCVDEEQPGIANRGIGTDGRTAGFRPCLRYLLTDCCGLCVLHPLRAWNRAKMKSSLSRPCSRGFNSILDFPILVKSRSALPFRDQF
jgi:hypothetical protein